MSDKKEITDDEIAEIKESLTIINDSFIRGLIEALESSRTELAAETRALERVVDRLDTYEYHGSDFWLKWARGEND